MSKNFDIIHGNPSQCLFAMVLPMMAAMFLNMAYNLVDSLWIGNLLGESAYAALTAATPILLLLNSIAMGATNGVAILLSQAIGAGETRRTRTILFTSFILSIVFSLGMTGLLEGMVSPLLRFLQVPSELYEMTCLYLRIYLLFCRCAAQLWGYGVPDAGHAGMYCTQRRVRPAVDSRIWIAGRGSGDGFVSGNLFGVYGVLSEKESLVFFPCC